MTKNQTNTTTPHTEETPELNDSALSLPEGFAWEEPIKLTRTAKPGKYQWDKFPAPLNGRMATITIKDIKGPSPVKNSIAKFKAKQVTEGIEPWEFSIHTIKENGEVTGVKVQRTK